MSGISERLREMKKQTEAGWVFLATVLVYLAMSIVFTFWQPPTNIRLVFVQVILILPTLCYLCINKLNIREALRIRKIKWINVPLLIVFAFLILPLLAVCNAVSMLFSSNVISGTVGDVLDSIPLIFSLVFIALIPCILEESVYRGMFYNEFRKIKPLQAALLSGLLFGLMHMNFNQFLYAFALGCILPLVIEATDSIVATMIIHFTINANSTIWMYLLPKLMKMMENTVKEMEQSQEAATRALLNGAKADNADSLNQMMNNVGSNKAALLGSIGFYAVVGVVTAILAFQVYKTIAKNEGRWEIVQAMFKKNPEHQTEGKKEHLLSVPLCVGMLLCVIMMIITHLST